MQVNPAYTHAAPISTYEGTYLNLKLAQNEVVLKDQTYDIFNRVEEKLSFLSIDSGEVTTRTRLEPIEDYINGKPNEKQIYFTVEISLSTTKNIYERESETILNLLGDIGGFQEAIYLVLSPLMLFYSAKWFAISISNGAPILMKMAKEPAGRR